MSVRGTRVGTGAAAIALATALLAGVNWLGTRHWWHADWTKAQEAQGKEPGYHG